MSDLYVLELQPRLFGLFKSKKNWQKPFPKLKQTSANKYSFKATKNQLSYYKRLCRHMRVDCIIYEDRFSRSATYRTHFLKNHPPISGDKYRCWYCGRKVKDICVDHIISIAAAKKDEKLQKYLKRKKIDINGEDNLALCCFKCNSSKGQKQSSFYIRRARLGRHEWYWRLKTLKKLLIAALFAAGAFFVYDSIFGSRIVLNYIHTLTS